MPDTVIRRATAADVGAIHSLLAEAGMVTVAILSEGSTWWVADRCGEVIGVAGLEIGQGAGLMRSVLVRFEERRHGLGARLTDHIFEHLRSIGISKIYLFSTEAGSYWQRLGFSEVAVDDLVTALPDAPEVLHFRAIGWLPTEVAFAREI